MTRAGILAGLWLATLSAAGWGGWSWRGDREAAELAAARAAQQHALIAAAEALSRQEYDLRLAQSALAARAQEHEDAARAAPDPCRLPDPDSLRRLRARWGGAAPAPD